MANKSPAHLRAIDVFVLLKLAAQSKKLSQSQIADQLGISVSTVNDALQRTAICGLFNRRREAVVIRGLTEFLEHGIRYVFPVVRGSLVRGMPTGHAASPLVEQLTAVTEWPPVWPTATGTERGYELVPLYPTAPQAAAKDSRFYELLALVDTLREGRPRESRVAAEELKQRLGDYQKTSLG